MSGDNTVLTDLMHDLQVVDHICFSRRSTIGETLSKVQQHFHLVPKKLLAINGECPPAPDGAIVDNLLNLWYEVSN